MTKYVKCFRCGGQGTKNGSTRNGQRYICTNEGCKNRNFFYDEKTKKYRFEHEKTFTYTYESAKERYRIYEDFKISPEFQKFLEELPKVKYKKLFSGDIYDRNPKIESLKIKKQVVESRIKKYEEKLNYALESSKAIDNWINELKAEEKAYITKSKRHKEDPPIVESV